MPKFCVLRINRFGKLTTLETYKVSKEDRNRSYVKITDTAQQTYELINDYGWNYNNNTKALYDRKKNKLVIHDLKTILQIINFFKDLNEAIESLLYPNKNKSSHIGCLIGELLKQQKRKINRKR